MQLVQHFRQYYTKVMDLPGAPKKIAYGVALGTALDFLPIPIISIPLGYVLARLLRINAPATVLAVIFFKWAVPFFYALDYMVGRLFLGDFPAPEIPEFTEGLAAWLYKLQHLGYPFLLGAGINSVLAGVTSYYVVRHLLDIKQRRRSMRIGRKIKHKTMHKDAANNKVINKDVKKEKTVRSKLLKIVKDKAGKIKRKK